MTGHYRIFGAEVSPYSVKVRSYFRYKQIPHEWIPRDPSSAAEYQKYAKLPIIPLVVSPEGEAMQDSTPILEAIEQRFPEPSIHPGDPIAAFVSALLEEFGDEWGNKWMFHYRWAREADQISGSERIAAVMSGAQGEALAKAAAAIRERMVGRVWFVGSNERTAPQIEQSFRDSVAQIEEHLTVRPYLFGSRPAFGDFAMWGQIYNAWTDPTPGGILRASAPNVVAWCQRMLDPKAEGGFESWTSLAPTLAPLLIEQVGRRFLPWSQANAKAIAGGAEEFSVELAGQTWTQKPQKYHAKSLKALRDKYAAAKSAPLDRVLAEVGCLEALRAG
jgi:glutathione S-transferase